MSQQNSHEETGSENTIDNSQEKSKDKLVELDPGNSSDNQKKKDEEQEYVKVTMSKIRKNVECPICLGIIRKTRTSMECMHRFCKVCIDKCMRRGTNECPTCRTHFPSRRALRDDPNYDALIAAIYPNIDKVEKEEEALLEEEFSQLKKVPRKF